MGKCGTAVGTDLDALIARLRDAYGRMSDTLEGLCAEAADALEAERARVESLTADLGAARGVIADLDASDTEYAALTALLQGRLIGVANALKGPPEADPTFGAIELVAGLKGEVDAERAEALADRLAEAVESHGPWMDDVCSDALAAWRAARAVQTTEERSERA